MYLTEKQRLDAIAACDAIVTLANKTQHHLGEAMRILEGMSRPPRQDEPEYDDAGNLK
jgi:hypothetical protein